MKYMIQSKWLECKLDKGMFSDEVAVTYPASRYIKKSVFVPVEFVQGNLGSCGKVRVSIRRHNNKIFAILPNSEHDIVEVNEIELS